MLLGIRFCTRCDFSTKSVRFFLGTNTYNKVRHVIQGGVAWFALPCSSWVFMCFSCTKCFIIGKFWCTFPWWKCWTYPKNTRSRGTTRRHYLRPQGWEEVVSTAVGNRLARRLAYLYGAHVCVCVCICACIRIIQNNSCLLIAKWCQNHYCNFWMAKKTFVATNYLVYQAPV